MFKQELLDMNQTGTNPTVSTRNSMAGTERAKFLEDGKEYEGLIVVVNNQHGTFFNDNVSESCISITDNYKIMQFA